MTKHKISNTTPTTSNENPPATGTTPDSYCDEPDPLKFSDDTWKDLKALNLSVEVIQDLESAARFWRHDMSRADNAWSCNRKAMKNVRNTIASARRKIQGISEQVYGPTGITFDIQAKLFLQAADRFDEYARKCLSRQKKVKRGGRPYLVERIAAALAAHGIDAKGYGSRFRKILGWIYIELGISDQQLGEDVKEGLERLREPYEGTVKRPMKQLRMALWDKAMEGYAEQLAREVCKNQEDEENTN